MDVILKANCSSILYVVDTWNVLPVLYENDKSAGLQEDEGMFLLRNVSSDGVLK